MPDPKRVLIIGIEPKAVDYSAAGIPRGLDAGKIRAGLDAAHDGLLARGYGAAECMLQLDDADDRRMTEALRAGYDCVVIGGGVRVPPDNLALFERVVNVVHRHAPQAAIAFNTQPQESVEAAERAMALAR